LLYQAQGEFAKAEPLYKRALAITEKALGPDHPDTAISLNNLASVHQQQGELAKAEPIFIRALAITEKVLGPSHPRTSLFLNNLALLYQAQGEFAKAEPLFIRALAITEKVLGPDHPATAYSLNNLAALHGDQGEYAKAEPLYKRALAITEKAVGPDHPDTAALAGNLAALYQFLSRDGLTLEYFERAAAAREHHLARELPSKAESSRLAFLQGLRRELHALVTWSMSLPETPVGRRARRLALRVLLERKGRVLDLGRETLSVLRSRASPADLEQIDALQSTRAQLAYLTHAQPSPGTDYALLRKRREALTSQAEMLEGALSRRFSDLRHETTPVTVQAVQRLIGERRALVEIAAYEPFAPTARKVDERWGKERYVAFVLFAQGEPVLVDLGERAPLDELAARHLAAIEHLSQDADSLGRQLHDAVIKPLRKALGSIRDLWLSPDGALSGLPWAALIDENGRPLVESYRLTCLTSGRDLLRLADSEHANGPAIVMGAPAYDGAPRSKPGLRLASQATVDTPARPRTAQKLLFPPLPATASEARRVAQLWPGAAAILGPGATEGVLKAANQPTIVHLATHGFLLEGTPAPPALPESRGVALLHGGTPFRISIENPLLLSGLALAGANQPGAGPDDGLLFALEVSALNLRGTKVVVLSACQTGQGLSSSGEGMYGLRRALVLAGSQAQVLSLWKVQDDTTARFMVAMHQKLAAGVARADALRDTQLELLRDKGTTHPFYWAAFFLQGDPTSFDGKAPRTLESPAAVGP
jgi:CHAT domain-containing protein